ncbi:MAG: hypothetical protein QXI38_05235 [Conexivisphaerales archaeon]
MAQKIAPSVPISSIIAYFFNTFTLALGAALAVATGIAVNKGGLNSYDHLYKGL